MMMGNFDADVDAGRMEVEFLVIHIHDVEIDVDVDDEGEISLVVQHHFVLQRTPPHGIEDHRCQAISTSYRALQD